LALRTKIWFVVLKSNKSNRRNNYYMYRFNLISVKADGDLIKAEANKEDPSKHRDLPIDRLFKEESSAPARANSAQLEVLKVKAGNLVTLFEENTFGSPSGIGRDLWVNISKQTTDLASLRQECLGLERASAELGEKITELNECIGELALSLCKITEGPDDSQLKTLQRGVRQMEHFLSKFKEGSADIDVEPTIAINHRFKEETIRLEKLGSESSTSESLIPVGSEVVRASESALNEESTAQPKELLNTQSADSASGSGGTRATFYARLVTGVKSLLNRVWQKLPAGIRRAGGQMSPTDWINLDRHWLKKGQVAVTPARLEVRQAYNEYTTEIGRRYGKVVMNRAYSEVIYEKQIGDQKLTDEVKRELEVEVDWIATDYRLSNRELLDKGMDGWIKEAMGELKADLSAGDKRTISESVKQALEERGFADDILMRGPLSKQVARLLIKEYVGDWLIENDMRTVYGAISRATGPDVWVAQGTATSAFRKDMLKALADTKPDTGEQRELYAWYAERMLERCEDSPWRGEIESGSEENLKAIKTRVAEIRRGPKAGQSPYDLAVIKQRHMQALERVIQARIDQLGSGVSDLKRKLYRIQCFFGEQAGFEVAIARGDLDWSAIGIDGKQEIKDVPRLLLEHANELLENIGKRHPPRSPEEKLALAAIKPPELEQAAEAIGENSLLIANRDKDTGTYHVIGVEGSYLPFWKSTSEDAKRFVQGILAEENNGNEVPLYEGGKIAVGGALARDYKQAGLTIYFKGGSYVCRPNPTLEELKKLESWLMELNGGDGSDERLRKICRCIGQTLTSATEMACGNQLGFSIVNREFGGPDASRLSKDYSRELYIQKVDEIIEFQPVVKGPIYLDEKSRLKGQPKIEFQVPIEIMATQRYLLTKAGEFKIASEGRLRLRVQSPAGVDATRRRESYLPTTVEWKTWTRVEIATEMEPARSNPFEGWMSRLDGYAELLKGNPGIRAKEQYLDAIDRTIGVALKQSLKGLNEIKHFVEEFVPAIRNIDELDQTYIKNERLFELQQYINDLKQPVEEAIQRNLEELADGLGRIQEYSEKLSDILSKQVRFLLKLEQAGIKPEEEGGYSRTFEEVRDVQISRWLTSFYKSLLDVNPERKDKLDRLRAHFEMLDLEQMGGWVEAVGLSVKKLFKTAEDLQQEAFDGSRPYHYEGVIPLAALENSPIVRELVEEIPKLELGDTIESHGEVRAAHPSFARDYNRFRSEGLEKSGNQIRERAVWKTIPLTRKDKQMDALRRHGEELTSLTHQHSFPNIFTLAIREGMSPHFTIKYANGFWSELDKVDDGSLVTIITESWLGGGPAPWGGEEVRCDPSQSRIKVCLTVKLKESRQADGSVNRTVEWLDRGYLKIDLVPHEDPSV
jgi:hypothetical protein